MKILISGKFLDFISCNWKKPLVTVFLWDPVRKHSYYIISILCNGVGTWSSGEKLFNQKTTEEDLFRPGYLFRQITRNLFTTTSSVKENTRRIEN